MKGTAKLIMLGIADSIIAVSGFSLWWFGRSYNLNNTGIILAMTAMLLAMVTFFGLMALSESLGRGWGLNKGGMRGAIASAVLVVYFFVLSMSMFQPYNAEMPEQMKSMLANFTTIIGIMIPFYFGASAYVQTHTKDNDKDEAPKDQVR